MNRGYRGYDASGFTLPITPTDGNSLESSFFWVEMKGLNSFRIPLKRKKAYYEGEKKPQSEATPKYPVLRQSSEGYKITHSGKPSSCGEKRKITATTKSRKIKDKVEWKNTQAAHLYCFFLFKGQLAMKCPTLLQ